MPKPILYFLVTNSLHQDQRLHRICSTLSKNGFDVTLVGVKRSEEVFSSIDFNSESLTTVFKSSFLFYLEINIRFFFFLLFKKMDGVVANDLDTLLATKLISGLRGSKLFIDLHEYFIEVPELDGKNIKKSIWSWIGRFGISRYSYNYTVNESLVQILGSKYKAKFDSIYNYPLVKSSLKFSRDDNNPFALVYVGAVNKGRGLKEAIHAVQDLNDVTLTIYGIGDCINEIQDLVEINQLQSKVFLKGFIDNKAIYTELQKYNLGINLLQDSSLNYYYSSANKYFDYIIAGILLCQ